MRLLPLLLCLLVAACDAPSPAPKPPSSQEKDATLVASHALPAATPARIVSLAPNITELLFALDLGDRVVGVTRYCDWPPQVKQLPSIGGFIDPDLEAILAQRPDLVVGMTSPGNEALPQALERAGLPYAFFKMDDLSQTIAATRALGAALHVPARGERLADALARSLAPRGAAQAGRPGALFVLGHDPIVVAGRGSFGHELLELAGATNLAPAAGGAYPALDVEAVVALEPALIIDAAMVLEDGPGPQQFWGKWATIPAVRDGRVHLFQDPSLLRPGPRLPEALHRMRAAVEAPGR